MHFLVNIVNMKQTYFTSIFFGVGGGGANIIYSCNSFLGTISEEWRTLICLFTSFFFAI